MPAGRRLELIIFDCDGVLVDSEPIAISVLVDALAAQGIAVTADEAYRDYLGRSLTTVSASLLASHGQPLEDATLLAMRENLYAAYRQRLNANPGLPAILDQLDLPICVASSSHAERIHLSLEVTGLLPWFEGRVFSAGEVANGKPEPDLFLHTAAAMGVAPAHCLVIEDSPVGIEAARRAGMAVFAYTGGSHIAPASLLPAITALAPDAIFADMHALPDLVRSPRTEKRAFEG